MKTIPSIIVVALLLFPYPSTLLAWTEPNTGIQMIRLEGGCYEMGCGSWTSECLAREKPLHEVCVKPFWIGKYEVTQGQWMTIMDKNPSQFKQGENYPVERVSWHQAREYIIRLNKLTSRTFSLPTEAQWEYAARSGGREEQYSGGEQVDEYGFHCFNSERTTHPVGEKRANGLGLHDMTGNVWEWCEDRYGGNFYEQSPRDNPKGVANSSFRVLRGGSWDYSPWYARTSTRHYTSGGFIHPSVGFRIVIQEEEGLRKK